MLSIIRNVLPSACLSGSLFTFEGPFKRIFALTFRSWISKVFRDSESLGKSNGKKWSHIWKLLLIQGVKSSGKKMFVFEKTLPYWAGFFGVFAWKFYTIYEQKFSNLRPLLSITFPQGSWKSKKFGHWTLGSGGKKTFKRNEQMKKICKKLFLPWQFYTLYEQKFQIWNHFFPSLFPKDSKNLKKIAHWTLGSEGKKDR